MDLCPKNRHAQSAECTLPPPSCNPRLHIPICHHTHTHTCTHAMGLASSRQKRKTSPATGVRYGIWANQRSNGAAVPLPRSRLPTAHVAGAMDPETTDYVFGELGEIDEAGLPAAGFVRCVDFPDIADHIYYEGYFHGLEATAMPVGSMNPRTGLGMAKPAAGPRLRAFLTAFRAVNQTWLAEAARSSPTLQRLYDAGCFFSDLAVQVHFGDAVPPQRVGWHCDGPNSVLHLALSLHGDRSLHTKTHPRADVDDRNHEPHATTEAVRSVYAQPRGAAYLSSPYAFLHGVDSPRCDWAGRVVAVQCRLLFADHGRCDHAVDAVLPGTGVPSSVANDAEVPVLEGEVTYDDLAMECERDDLAMLRAITAALLAAVVVFPTLEQVKEAQAKLQA